MFIGSKKIAGGVAMLDAWQTVWVCVILSVLVLALDAWLAGQGFGAQKAVALAQKRAQRQRQMVSGQSTDSLNEVSQHGEQR